MILLKTPDGKAATARLTTDHPASSYGLPVLVLTATGEALGPADLALRGYAVKTATQIEQAELRRAGYRLE